MAYMLDRVKVFGKCMATANREFLLTIKSVPPICYDLENKFNVLVCVFYKLI
jgi:hypothetical protein